jgi:hypothetical protein
MLTVPTAPSETERARAVRKRVDFWCSRAESLARQSEMALAPRLLLDHAPLATSHLSGNDRRANSSLEAGGSFRGADAGFSPVPSLPA